MNEPTFRGSRAEQELAWNFRLLAHHDLGGFGGLGEGIAIQMARDGRRILWLAHESAPKNFAAVEEVGENNRRHFLQCGCAGL